MCGKLRCYAYYITTTTTTTHTFWWLYTWFICIIRVHSAFFKRRFARDLMGKISLLLEYTMNCQKKQKHGTEVQKHVMLYHHMFILRAGCAPKPTDHQGRNRGTETEGVYCSAPYRGGLRLGRWACFFVLKSQKSKKLCGGGGWKMTIVDIVTNAWFFFFGIQNSKRSRQNSTLHVCHRNA